MNAAGLRRRQEDVEGSLTGKLFESLVIVISAMHHVKNHVSDKNLTCFTEFKSKIEALELNLCLCVLPFRLKSGEKVFKQTSIFKNLCLELIVDFFSL